MGSTPNNGQFYDGAPVIGPIVIYDATGKPISSTNPLPISLAIDAISATVTNDGTFAKETGGNLAAAKTDLDTIVTNTNKIPASPAQEGGNLATLVTNTTGVATAANQTTGNTSLSSIATNTSNTATNTSNTSTVLGATSDTAVVGDNTGSVSAKLRGLTKILNDIWDSTNHLFAMNVKQIGGQTPTLDNTTIQAVSMRGKGAGTAGDTALLLDSLGQMTIEQFVQYQIMQGHGFSATTGQVATGAANAFVCMQLAVNAISKKVLIYSISIGNSTGTESDGRLYLASAATADTSLTTNLTATNSQPKNATVTALTTLTGSPASTTQTTGFQGTQTMNWITSANTNVEVLLNGRYVYFANGDTASLEVAQKKTTSANTCSINIAWVEW